MQHWSYLGGQCSNVSAPPSSQVLPDTGGWALPYLTITLLPIFLEWRQIPLITITWLNRQRRDSKQQLNHLDSPTVVPELVNLLLTFELPVTAIHHFGARSILSVRYILQQQSTVLVLTVAYLLHLILCHLGTCHSFWFLEISCFQCSCDFFLNFLLYLQKLGATRDCIIFVQSIILKFTILSCLSDEQRDKSKKWSVEVKISLYSD